MIAAQPLRRPHYNSPAARTLDLVIHALGLAFGLVGGVVLLVLARDRPPGFRAGLAVYAIGFVLMLSFSLAYNFGPEARKAVLRRLDHSGIFLMIAGSYTPFTIRVLDGGWAIGMTVGVWLLATAGILVKLLRPDVREGLSNALYLALGWIVVVAIVPIVRGLAPSALMLLVGGGVVYTVGVIFHVKEDLTFSRPIWHGHVVVAAGLHWAAILIGTVLPATV